VARAEAAEAALAAAEADAARSKGPCSQRPMRLPTGPEGSVLPACPEGSVLEQCAARLLRPTLWPLSSTRREERGESPRRVVAAWLPKRRLGGSG